MRIKRRRKCTYLVCVTFSRESRPHPSEADVTARFSTLFTRGAKTRIKMSPNRHPTTTTTTTRIFIRARIHKK